MQTLRKKTSPLKYKNETTRFLGDGVSFKAKLIGILEVSEARGDRMCQEALSDLKMAIRAAGEHKQRITIHIALDGLRLRDEKTGDSLYHHPVHKISFIAQDMTDSRAFGYIFGSPDTGHRFFGIKTDKAASQVVIAMRDLFQVVFALKKKEIEIAKIHLEKTRFPTSPIFSDSSTAGSKLQTLTQDKITGDSKAAASVSDSKSSGTAVADLVDLELELNSLQQGLNQMERITPSDPFGSKDDPFGDSFISYPKPILPPPPSSGRERSNRTSDSSSLFSPKTPHTGASLDTNATDSSANKKDFSFSQDFNSSHEEPSSGDWFTPSAGNSLFEEPASLHEVTKDEKHERAKQEILSQFDVFTELDPLELKNPPKKALNDLVSNNQQTNNNQNNQDQPNVFTTNFNLSQQKAPSYANNSNIFTNDPFGEDPFVKEDPFAEADFTKQDPFESELNNFDMKKLDNLANFLTKQMTQTSLKAVLTSTSPRTVQFEALFNQFEEKQVNKLAQLHDNPSLDISSESECAPEPPPRPAVTLMQIKPPPLPPKKQNKPLPRLPQTEESHYDYMDNYETAPNSIEFVKDIEKSPPLPVPARKSKFESDFTVPPERPKKQINIQSSEEDYLTPIKYNKETAESGGAQSKKSNVEPNLSAEGLDITLSQLTLSGLNELAAKLNIPSSQLSNMTLAQLTNFLSNFVKANNLASNENSGNVNSGGVNGGGGGVDVDNEPSFQADFAANFNNLNADTYDRYAVFRELMQEEIKQTKIDTEPEQLQEEKQQLENNVNLNLTSINDQNNCATDKYAALREIVETELKQNENVQDVSEQDENSLDIENNENNIVNKENKFNVEDKEQEIITSPKNTLIEYTPTLVENKENKIISPIKSPKQNIVKSPIPSAVTEIIQTNTRLTSGSLSDVISGSSPEVDNTANSDSGKKATDATGESWAIFDQANLPTESTKEKQAIQSEEGVSPWSSDSKEFGNSSPPEWRGGSSSSRNEHWSKRRRDQEGWWDTSAEPEMQYYPSNRRSTDSYEDEYYECYDRPRRRRQGGSNWASGGSGGQAAGGHSSSSRDVSPWEEEPCRRDPRDSRESRSSAGWSNWHGGRQHSFERHRHTDSWDEEDDYEYDDEHGTRFHWNERHSSRDSDRDRHSGGSREHDPDRWIDDRSEDRRHRRRRDLPNRDRWCCPDWEQTEHEKGARYSRWATAEPSTGKWRERKLDPRYYSRDSQESPWEDEYSNEPEDVHSNYYLSAKRNWKQRPSSASEMDRKTGEIKSRHYLGTGGSDTERDRRYKTARRSRSRDSQYSEPSHRHKTEPTASGRISHRTKLDVPKKLENSKVDLSNKKSSTLNRKKSKESPQSEENMVSTFPRKSATSRVKSLFENDFVESPPPPLRTKFHFDNDFETSETDSPTTSVNRSIKAIKQQNLYEKERFKETKLSPRYQMTKKSLFEDDFSPSNEKQNDSIADDSISSIKEEKDAIEEEEEDSFSTSAPASTATTTTTNQPRRKILSKTRNNIRTDINLKKSESVNIFARENDPFDDDFFSGTNVVLSEKKVSPRNTELRWTEDFEDFDTDDKK